LLVLGIEKKERLAVENCGQNFGFCSVYKKNRDDEFNMRGQDLGKFRPRNSADNFRYFKPRSKRLQCFALSGHGHNTPRDAFSGRMKGT
jgi:hypothetical protein